MKSRWLPRSLVILTAIFCLGVGGYAGQAWLSRMEAKVDRNFRTFGGYPDRKEALDALRSWRATPWYGEWIGESPFWYPRGHHVEYLRLVIGGDLGNDPDAWEAWFRAHPNLLWDEKRERLVEVK